MGGGRNMISFVVSLILLGGFYEWNATIIGMSILVEILFFYQKKKPIYQREKNIFFWIPGIIFVWMIGVSFWALDRSEHMLGILRGVILLFWLYRCFLMEEEEKKKIFKIIPYIGAIMVGVGGISLAQESLAAYFWQARRFGGFFQYPNTCALFLMIGLVLQIDKLVEKNSQYRKQALIQNVNCKYFNEVNKSYTVLEVVVLMVLIVGLFLTGCRSVLLLFLLWGIYKAVKIKELRVPFFTMTALTIFLVYGYSMLVGDQQNIARIFTIFKANSTIYGRMLYGIDALSMVVKQPLGLGYRGYFYMQPMVQTGVYTTRFVHNDFLQIMVDYGIFAFLLVVVYLGYQILKGKQTVLQKEMLILMLTASLMDFHMQYMSLLMLLVLCFDLGEKGRIIKRRDLRENYIFIVVGMIVLLYFTVAFGANYCGNYSLALKVFPSYTEAQINVLKECKEKEEAVDMADKILFHNKYVAEAYHIKVYAAVLEEDFLQAVEYIDKSLMLRRYDVERYKNYDDLFDEMIRICHNKDKIQEVEILKKKKEELPQKLAALEEETHPLAFLLRDQPQFMW